MVALSTPRVRTPIIFRYGSRRFSSSVSLNYDSHGLLKYLDSETKILARYM